MPKAVAWWGTLVSVYGSGVIIRLWLGAILQCFLTRVQRERDEARASGRKARRQGWGLGVKAGIHWEQRQESAVKMPSFLQWFLLLRLRPLRRPRHNACTRTLGTWGQKWNGEFFLSLVIVNEQRTALMRETRGWVNRIPSPPCSPSPCSPLP